MTPGDHQGAARVAHDVAIALHDVGSAWYVVAAHYAALHLIHASLLADRTDLEPEMREPTRHRSHFGSDGRKAWGLNDVVRVAYPSEVSRPFTALVSGSHAVRYSAPFPAGERFWSSYQELRQALES